MTRFFFDFVQAGQHTKDAEGIELPNVEQAYLEAFRASQEMWSELLKQRRDPRRCIFEVRNGADEILFHFPLQEVMDCCIDRTAAPVMHTFEQLAQTQNYASRIRAEFAREVQTTKRILQDSHQLLKHPVG
jgi:hypothetical protein